MISELTEKAQRRLRRAVGRYAFTIDGAAHRLHLPNPLMHNLCLAADITVGWGPSATDWEKQKTAFLSAFYRWFWQGRCPECGGDGKFAWMEIRREDGSYRRETDVTCFACNGSGQDQSGSHSAFAG